MMWHGDGLGWGGWLIMGMTVAAFWVFVVVAVIALTRVFREPGSGKRPTRPDPRQLLDERFARGELDAEEYEARRNLLSQGR